LIFHQASKSATWTAQKTVWLESIRNFTVPLPPLAEQQKIIEEVEYRLSIVDELEQTIDAGIKKSENLKQSILKRAFSWSLI
jgi:type I restriction enzyme S subunit